MRARQNSTSVFNEIRAKGLLSDMRWRVYAALFEHGPATAAELASKFPPSVGGRGEAGNIHARLGELVALGVATITQERKCRIVQHNQEVFEYDVTNKLPRKPAQKAQRLSKRSKKVLKAMKRAHPEHAKAIDTVLELNKTWGLRQVTLGELFPEFET